MNEVGFQPRACQARHVWLLLFPVLSLACASTPYSFAAHGETSLTLALRPGEAQVERGVPNAWIDGFGHYFFSLPTKLVLLDWKVDDHSISPEVEEALVEYLQANGLRCTKVRLNQYAPGDEWRRLAKNREMPGGWRYTVGALSVVFYTVFPERLLAGFPFIGGGDHYNPYTNTISLYSDRRPVGLHEGGHAKDFAGVAGRQWKGIYAASRSVPLLGLVVALWQEGVATNDALSWELATAGSRESKEAYRSLYPAYGTYLGGTAQSAASFFVDGWILYAIQYGAVVAGHVVGQTRALLVPERAEGLEPQLRAGLHSGGDELETGPGPGPTAAISDLSEPDRAEGPAAAPAPSEPPVDDAAFEPTPRYSQSPLVPKAGAAPLQSPEQQSVP